VKGAKLSAMLYSLVSIVGANGLEPYAYLRRPVHRVTEGKKVERFEALLPFNTIVAANHNEFNRSMLRRNERSA